jgi:predicted ATP-dependent serine protease
MARSAAADEAPLVTTGVAGLDDVLGGGLTAHRLYLLEGNPGSGKTTLALQFLLEGARRGERGVYVTLAETKLELTASARSHGWSLGGEVRQALSVVKKRTGRHERTIRELRLEGGIRVGEPLREFQGVLTGVPHYGGRPAGLGDD